MGFDAAHHCRAGVVHVRVLVHARDYETEVSMGYQEALEAAGATVLAFETFGSYQGDWLALVERNGQRGWIKDYFGSCSYCDAFEADIGWEPYEYDDEDEPPYSERKAEYDAKVKAFGERYFETPLLTTEEVLAKVSENLEWDTGADDMVAFVKAHA